MYINLFSRPISFKEKIYSKGKVYVIYPDVVKELGKNKVDCKFVKKHGTCSTIKFYAKVAYFNRKKLTPKKVVYNLKKKARLAAKRGFN